MAKRKKITSQPGHPPKSSAGGVFALLGRLLATALVLAAGVAGWFGVEQLALAESETVPLPDLGEGLPTSRLDQPAPWRQFQLTYSHDGIDETYWFDLDTWRIRTEVLVADGINSMEIEGDRGFSRLGSAGEWVEQDAATTRDIASYVMGGIGPFLLTDLLPPNSLGFTSLELEGTSKGERVYEVAVDALTLREQHPLAYERWVSSTRIVASGSGQFRIRVRQDGYIVRIDGDDAVVTWTELPAGVRFSSPLAPTATAGDTPGAPPLDSTLNAPQIGTAESSVPVDTVAPVDPLAPVAQDVLPAAPLEPPPAGT